jgi:uncharacterized protein (TIGR00251 family)
MIRPMPSANIALRVHASSRANELVGLKDGVLIVRVTAPAIEGRANEAVRRLVAKHLRVPKSAVTIVRGGHSRDKVIQVAGLDNRAVLEAFAGSPALLVRSSSGSQRGHREGGHTMANVDPTEELIQAAERQLADAEEAYRLDPSDANQRRIMKAWSEVRRAREVRERARDETPPAASSD